MKTDRYLALAAVTVYLLISGIVCRADDNRDYEAQKYFGHIQAPCAKDKDVDCKKLKSVLDWLNDDPECKKIDVDINNGKISFDHDGNISKTQQYQGCAHGKYVLEQIFGKSYHPMLPDYLVYFKKEGTDKFVAQTPVLIWNNKNTPHLYGARDIFAVVLTEQKACLNASVHTDYKNEPNPFVGIASALGTKIDTDKAKPSEDKPAQFRWYPLSGNPDPKYAGLWLAIARIPTDVNSVNRITVQYTQPKAASGSDKGNQPEECISKETVLKDEKHEKTDSTVTTEKEGTTLKAEKTETSESKQTTENETKYTGDFLAANGFFSNSPDDRVAISFALGATLNARGTAASSGRSAVAFNGYLVAKYYFIRPKLHADPDSDTQGYYPSLGIFVGFNVAHTVFKEVVFGLSYGNVNGGNGGFLIGINSIAGKDGTQDGRKQRPFIGFDYTF